MSNEFTPPRVLIDIEEYQELVKLRQNEKDPKPKGYDNAKGAISYLMYLISNRQNPIFAHPGLMEIQESLTDNGILVTSNLDNTFNVEFN